MASIPRGRNEPPPRPIIVKKIYEVAHAGHHGGAWKIAYADFVTAMMTLFLLLWLVGATDQNKRQGIADYFTPTLVQYKENSAGSNGILSGDSIIGADNYPHRATQTGSRAMTIPRDATGGIRESSAPRSEDIQRFRQLVQELAHRIQSRPDLRPLQNHVRFSQTAEGLRIDLLDQADFSMFQLGTDQLLPPARQLVQQIAQVIEGVPNAVIIRGHTDARAYTSGAMNNWMLSTARAESTRATLQGAGVELARFDRIEGVAERDPYVAADPLDPRNRRISITLAWQDANPRHHPGPAPAMPSAPAAPAPAAAH